MKDSIKREVFILILGGQSYKSTNWSNLEWGTRALNRDCFMSLATIKRLLPSSGYIVLQHSKEIALNCA